MSEPYLRDVNTVDELIEAATELREKFGGDFPVWSYNDGLPAYCVTLTEEETRGSLPHRIEVS